MPNSSLAPIEKGQLLVNVPTAFFPKSLQINPMSSHLNFAQAVGIDSLPGAIIFTVLYVPLLVFFARKSFTHSTYVHYVLTLFCAIRVAGFAIRIALTTTTSAEESLGLVIADETLFAVGYFGLLYSAYTLVLDRMLLSDSPPPNNPIIRLTQDRRLFRITLLVALVLGIISATSTNSNGTTTTTAKSLRIASTVIFLILTVLQAFQTIYLARSKVSGQSQYYTRGKDSFGIQHGNYILVAISLLLLVREVFTIATVNTAKQLNEHFWYPLVVLPEILVVILYITPGLVPRKDEIPAYSLTEMSGV